MSNYNNLKTTIDANIKQNGNQEITGPILNSVLNQMVNILGTGYQFAGVATLDPATDPGTPDAKVFYIANGKGTYEKFGGLEVTEDDVVVLYWDTAWHKVSTGIASQVKLSKLQTEINGKQEALTLTVKDNGNIVLANIQGQSKEFMPATPSGDPMHYAYVIAGAEYNGTGADIVKTAPWADMVDDDYTRDYGKTVVHKAGYWYLNGLGDLTNKSMQNAYTKSILCNVVNQSMRFYNGQTNFNFYNFLSTNPLKGESSFASSNCKTILMNDNKYANRRLETGVSHFYNAANLLHIIGIFSDNTNELNNTFTLCKSLITLKFYGLQHNVSFSDSLNLSIKSILYMIQNEAATSAITITLHADAYARAMANADILAALEAHPNVSLASA